MHCNCVLRLTNYWSQLSPKLTVEYDRVANGSTNSTTSTFMHAFFLSLKCSVAFRLHAFAYFICVSHTSGSEYILPLRINISVVSHTMDKSGSTYRLPDDQLPG